MALVLVTDAAQLLPLDEIKHHCRITADDLDQQLTGLAEAAAEWIETYTGRVPRSRVYDLVLDRFPSSRIELPRAPLVSVTAASCTYVTDGGTVTQIPTTVYVTDTESLPGSVYLGYAQFWPLARYQPRAVRVRFTAGYATIDLLPEPLRQASLLHIQNHLDSAGGDEKMTKAAEMLAWPWRIWA